MLFDNFCAVLSSTGHSGFDHFRADLTESIGKTEEGEKVEDDFGGVNPVAPFTGGVIPGEGVVEIVIT